MPMHYQRETNPHFSPSQSPTRLHGSTIEFSPLPRHQGPTPHPPRRKIRPPPPSQFEHDSDPRLSTPPPPHTQPWSQSHVPPPPPQLDHDTNPPPQRQSRRQPQHPRSSTLLPPLGPPRHQKDPHPVSPHHNANEHGHGNSIRLPENRKTNPLVWLIGAICAILWIIIIVGGLIILIVYLVFRPRNPKFDISTVSLNAAYLDMGYFLNADLTVLANFTNPNSKVNIDFSYVVFDLFYNEKLIATRYIAPFSVMKAEYRFADVHLMSSQVRLPLADSLNMQRQIENGRVNYEIRGLFRAKSKLGGFLRYSYWLSAHCRVVLGSPPTGILISKRCEMKREGIP